MRGRSIQGRRRTPPMSASTTTTGVARLARPEDFVTISATTTITASPAGMISPEGNRTPARNSSRAPQPSDSNPRTRGNRIQAAKTVIALETLDGDASADVWPRRCSSGVRVPRRLLAMDKRARVVSYGIAGLLVVIGIDAVIQFAGTVGQLLA